jgi:glutamate-1-semialdehyde 2,1-aminomutase
VAAGLAALELIDREDPYPALESTAEELLAGLAVAFDANGIEATINRAGSLLSVFFGRRSVRNFDDAKSADHERFARFFQHMLGEGVYLPPSGYELWTLCTAFGDTERETVLGAVSRFRD